MATSAGSLWRATRTLDGGDAGVADPTWTTWACTQCLVGPGKDDRTVPLVQSVSMPPGVLPGWDVYVDAGS